MSDDAPILAPPGWGYRPGLRLVDTSAPVTEWLPELPMLRLLRGKDRNAAIVTALRDTLPREQLRQIRQRDLEHKYALVKSSANVVLIRLRGNPP